jgi:DNA-binding transcriptional ArsR family regulator
VVNERKKITAVFAALADPTRRRILHLIRARAAGLREAQKWIAHYAAGWDAAFDALDELLESEQRKEKKT